MNEAFYLFTAGEYSDYCIEGLYRGPAGLEGEIKKYVKELDEELMGAIRKMPCETSEDREAYSAAYMLAREKRRGQGGAETVDQANAILISRKFGLTKLPYAEIAVDG